MVSLTHRSPALREIGLTEKDLEERVIVAVGWRKGELLPPYTNGVRQPDAQRVLNYLQGKKFRRFPGEAYYDVIRKRFNPPPTLVEIVGSFDRYCVRFTAESFLNYGSSVLLDPRFIIPNPPTRSPLVVRRNLLKGLLHPRNLSPQRRCLRYDEKLIFYEKLINKQEIL